MPRLVQTDVWVKPFRRQVAVTCGERWQPRNCRGRLRLEVKGVGSVTLPYAWSEEGAAKALPRIQQICKRFADGAVSLKAAAQSTETASSRHKIDFSALVEEFREFKPNVSDATWDDKYRKVLSNCADLFEGQPPKDGTELCMDALRQWKQGSRSRQLARQNLFSFLKWAVGRGHLKSLYMPPAELIEIRNPKRIGYALSDVEIIHLLDALPTGHSHEPWKFAIQLCAVYGLRPEELRNLAIKNGPLEAELWTNYRKSKGGKRGDRTEPRQLHALLIKDSQGIALDWKLEDRFKAGERLPPLGQTGNAGTALGQYLRRKDKWQKLKAEAATKDEELVSYTFRHRYAKESHAAGIPVADIASAMGHSIQVHLQNYARFTPDQTHTLYKQANDRARGHTTPRRAQVTIRG